MNYLTLESMALSRADYINRFCNQEMSIVQHLIKIFCIDDGFNLTHWVKEINNIFGSLEDLHCKVKVTKEELKAKFISYSSGDGNEWKTILRYCLDEDNFNHEVHLYSSGLKPCSLIPEILNDFVKSVVKGDVVKVEYLTPFKKALNMRSKDSFKVSASEVKKLKNKIWQGGSK